MSMSCVWADAHQICNPQVRQTVDYNGVNATLDPWVESVKSKNASQHIEITC